MIRDLLAHGWTHGQPANWMPTAPFWRWRRYHEKCVKVLFVVYRGRSSRECLVSVISTLTLVVRRETLVWQCCHSKFLYWCSPNPYQSSSRTLSYRKYNLHDAYQSSSRTSSYRKYNLEPSQRMSKEIKDNKNIRMELRQGESSPDTDSRVRDPDYFQNLVLTFLSIDISTIKFSWRPDQFSQTMIQLWKCPGS